MIFIKKIIIFIILVLILLITFKSDELIRIRIIGNSNSNYDQEIKNKISKDISSTMYDLLKNETNITNARKKIVNNMDKVENIIKEDLKDVSYDYKINYGMNYFPQKKYNGVTYKEGEYESLLITLGEGKGDNWWCILFPPFCLIEAEEDENIEYSFFFDKIFTYFKNK